MDAHFLIHPFYSTHNLPASFPIFIQFRETQPPRVTTSIVFLSPLVQSLTKSCHSFFSTASSPSFMSLVPYSLFYACVAIITASLLPLSPLPIHSQYQISLPKVPSDASLHDPEHCSGPWHLEHHVQTHLSGVQGPLQLGPLQPFPFPILAPFSLQNKPLFWSEESAHFPRRDHSRPTLHSYHLDAVLYYPIWNVPTLQPLVLRSSSIMTEQTHRDISLLEQFCCLFCFVFVNSRHLEWKAHIFKYFICLS